MSREGKKFPEIQVYPQPHSAYQIIEPYVDFVADLEADKVRSEIMHAEGGTQLRSQTTPSKSRKQQQHHAPIPLRSQTASSKSPRNIRTAPASIDSQGVRESLMSVKKNSQPSVLLALPPPFPFPFPLGSNRSQSQDTIRKSCWVSRRNEASWLCLETKRKIETSLSGTLPSPPLLWSSLVVGWDPWNSAWDGN